jgi:hypothetical protein
LPDHPTGDEYARATLAILTSFLARAHAQGQSFLSFDALVKTSPADVRQGGDDWLPPTLFAMAVNEALKLRASGGAGFVLAKAGGTPSLVLTLKDGTKLAGRFELTKEGRVRGVTTEVLLKGTPRPPAATRPTGRPRGEMLR